MAGELVRYAEWGRGTERAKIPLTPPPSSSCRWNDPRRHVGRSRGKISSAECEILKPTPIVLLAMERSVPAGGGEVERQGGEVERQNFFS